VVATIGWGARYQRPIGAATVEGEIQIMYKRVVAAGLWFYATWTAGAVLAMALHLDAILGPILAIATTAIVAVDPRRVIWTSR
jgi:hypothetical protein